VGAPSAAYYEGNRHGGATWRVLRGASWNNNEENNLRSSRRNNNTPTTRNNNNGVILRSSGSAVGLRFASRVCGPFAVRAVGWSSPVVAARRPAYGDFSPISGGRVSARSVRPVQVYDE